MSKAQFRTLLQEKNIHLSDEQMEQFHIYYKTLVEWNEKMNLTAITDEDEVYLKHFYDSISAAFYYNFDEKSYSILDVGAGAGFPSLPLKICFPHLQVSIVDSLNKRIRFLEHLSEKLSLSNVYFYHDRAETFGQNKVHRESYDIVLARAVARMPVLAELCLPFAKVGGAWIAMKGAGGQEELGEAKKALNVLGGEVASNEKFSLPIEKSDRQIIIVNKVKETPKKYPRNPGTPNKQPIGAK